MAQFNLCFRVAFLAVLLPLASGEHHIILNLLERFIFILQSTCRVLGWRFLSVMSAVALGFLSRSPYESEIKQFELFINQKCRVTILKLLCSNEEIRW